MLLKINRNYIKTLILSTIVLVIGNNSNYCYSMVVNNSDNIAQNGQSLQDKRDFSLNFKEQLNNLQDLIKDIIRNKNVTKSQQRELTFISNNFMYRHKMCFEWLYYKDRGTQPFNLNIVNKEIPGLISQDILNQYSNVTFEQLLKYISNEIYLIMINDIKRIINTINSWDDQNINELIDEIICGMTLDYYKMENIIQSFFNFCDNHLNEINQDFVHELKKRCSYFIKILYRLKNDFLTKFNFNDTCTKLMNKLHSNLSNRQNPPRNADLIYDFSKIYNGIIGQIDDNNFLKNLVCDYSDAYNNVTSDDLDNAIAFTKQLSNSITFHVINIIINIKDQMFNHNLNQQQLEELIANNTSHCIDDIINASEHVKNSIIEYNSPLRNIYENDDIIKKISDSIKTRIKRLHQLKLVHHVDNNGIKRTFDNKAIPDIVEVENGNIAMNEHFLQDSNYLENQFNDSKNILETQLNNLVENRVYNQGDVRSLLNKLNNFFNKCSNLCDSIARIDERLMPQSLFKVGDEDDNTIDILNSEESGFDVIVAPDKNTTTFKQLSNYLVNKIYYLIIDSIRKMSEDTSSNLNINDLKKSINNKIFECSTNIEKNINVFLNFCYHNINDEETNNFIKLIIPYTNQLQLTLFHKNNNLNSYQ